MKATTIDLEVDLGVEVFGVRYLSLSVPVRLLIPKIKGADPINMLDMMGSEQITTPPLPQHLTQRSSRGVDVHCSNLRAPVGFARRGRHCPPAIRLYGGEAMYIGTTNLKKSRRQSRHVVPLATASNHRLTHTLRHKT